MLDHVKLPQVDAEVERRRALCKAAFSNAFALCQVHLAGRSHWTAADQRLFDAVWTLALRTFDPANPEQETAGDHIPHTQEQQAAPVALAAVEAALAPKHA